MRVRGLRATIRALARRRVTAVKPPPPSSSAALLGPDGPFARVLPHYESRPAQLELARGVERALRDRRVLLCEAGTGTGKSLGYLVPALLSGLTVVVSTATRALQEQLVQQDLPLVSAALGREFSVAVLKGLGNYVCRRRYGELRRSARALEPEVARRLALAEPWVAQTAVGDRAEFSDLAEDDPFWDELTSSPETRLAGRCEHYRECFVTGARERAAAARLIIVNHHLFFADLALRGEHPARLLPQYDAVVFDEAHQLEAVATRFFGVTVSRSMLERLVQDFRQLSGGPLFANRAVLEGLAGANAAWWASVTEHARRGPAAGEGRGAFDADGFDVAKWHRLDDALEAAAGWGTELAARLAPRAAARAAALEVAVRRASQLREDLAAVLEARGGRVPWFEASGRGPTLGASPVDVGAILRERLFEAPPALVFTSATLASRRVARQPADAPAEGALPADASAGADAPPSPSTRASDRASDRAFDFFRARLGLSDLSLPVDELVLPSPFDFPANALLYVARDLPEPRAPAFEAAMVARVIELIELTGGGAFVLTTSLRSMRAVHRALRERLPALRLFMQSEAPKGALLEAFRRHGDAVLVATQSFWEGVDVPGRALRLVILEKIPFQVPSDPLGMARDEACQAAGGNPFTELHVPSAALALKQGFGRLIRTRSDRGIVALLDERVVTRGYGRRLLEVLPPARRTERLDDVKAFWAGVTGTT